MTDKELIDNLLNTASFTANRNSSGMQIMIRGRRIRSDQYAGSVFPVVLTLEYQFIKEREDGLPTSEQHAAYGEFILPIIDAIENARLGVHVLGDTTDGLVREWFYVSDVHSFAKMAKQYKVNGFDYEINYDDDPDWAMLNAQLCQIRSKW